MRLAEPWFSVSLLAGCQGNFPSAAHHQDTEMCHDMPPYPKTGQKSAFKFKFYTLEPWPYHGLTMAIYITRAAAPWKLAHFVNGMAMQLSMGRLPCACACAYAEPRRWWILVNNSTVMAIIITKLVSNQLKL